MRARHTPPPPLDAAALERLALRYVERYATTRAKLAGYLSRKLRERGTAEPMPDIDAIVERFAQAGYVDDSAFAEMRAASMARRGLGRRRIAQALRHAGIAQEDLDSIEPEILSRRVETALAFARRKRFGPFAQESADRDLRERQIAAMVRAGHDFSLARKIVSLSPGEDVSFLSEES